MNQFFTVKPREVIGFAVTVAAITSSIVLWSIGNFQSKQDAQTFKEQTENRVNRVENELSNLRQNISDIAGDVKYIRGRLEPKINN